AGALVAPGAVSALLVAPWPPAIASVAANNPPVSTADKTRFFVFIKLLVAFLLCAFFHKPFDDVGLAAAGVAGRGVRFLSRSRTRVAHHAAAAAAGGAITPEIP